MTITALVKSKVTTFAISSIGNVIDALGLGKNSTARYAILNKQRGSSPIAKFAITSVEVNKERMVTRHPVENGSTTSDHVYRTPITVVVTGVMSREYANAKGQVASIFANQTSTFSVLADGQTYDDLVCNKVSVSASQETFDASNVTITFTQFMKTPVKTGLMNDSEIPAYNARVNQSNSMVMTTPSFIQAALKAK